jgi:CHRD domain
VPLTPPTAGNPGASSGCVTVAATLAADILAHPKAYYVNVHTGDFPAGAVRGQLKRLHRHHD